MDDFTKQCLKDCYTTQRQKKLEEFKRLISDRDQLNHIERGRYNVQIKQIEEDIEEYNHKLANLDKENTVTKGPREHEIFLYVIASTREKVRKNFSNDTLFNTIDADRYHEVSSSEWKPFSKGRSISAILEGLSLNQMYILHYIYVDANPSIDDEHWIKVDAYISSSIAIVDLFSLFGDNQTFASKFDRATGSALLFPCCKDLSKDEHIETKFMDSKTKFKTLYANLKKHRPCELFFSTTPDETEFINDLYKVFKIMFPISNKSNSPSDKGKGPYDILNMG